MRFIYILIVIMMCGCANTSKFNDRLSSIVGKDENKIFSVLGYPDKMLKIDYNTVVYIWENNESGYKTKHRSNIIDGYIGDTPITIYDNKEYVVPYKYNCILKYIVKNGIAVSWECDGNMGACKKYIDRINSLDDSIFTKQHNQNLKKQDYQPDIDNFVGEDG